MSSLSICNEWRSNPLKNPRTNRPITYMGPKYRELLEECEQHKQKKTPTPKAQTPKAPTPKQLPTKQVIIYIKGLMDCKEKTWDNYLQNTFSNKYLEVQVECDGSTLNIFKDIVKTYCYMKPSTTNKFVVSIHDKINKLLLENYNVTIIGHSYGGSVAARLATMFNSHSHVAKLQIVTLGSIFNIKKSEASNVNLVQYMYSNDVALRCANIKSFDVTKTGLKHHYDPDTNIVWLPKPSHLSKQWDIHNAYGQLCSNIIYHKDIHYPMKTKST